MAELDGFGERYRALFYQIPATPHKPIDVEPEKLA
jgi:hypothetical protein